MSEEPASKKPKVKEEKENFIWTDDEVELLLSVVNNYKVKYIAKGIDWESNKEKYVDITAEFNGLYPSKKNKFH